MSQDVVHWKNLPARALASLLLAGSSAFGSEAAAFEPASTPAAVPADDRQREPLPTLEVILELTSARAPEVELGDAAVRSSRSSLVGARRPPLGNPQLTVFGERGDGVTEDLYLEGQLDLPIEVWGQRRKRIAEANALIALTRADADVARASALADAVEAYGQAVVSLARLQATDAAITAAQTEAAVYRARLELQDATLRDAHLATMEVARNEVLRVEARASLRSALGQLERLTGRRFEAAVASADAVEPPVQRTLHPSDSDVGESPVVRASQAEAEYYEQSGERAESEGRMPFSVLLRAVRGDAAEARFGGGLSLGFPVFQRNQGERARALAEAERARRTSAIQMRAIEATRDALRGELEQLVEARRIIETVALPAARDAVAAAEEIQRTGKGELLPILISRRDYAALRLRRLDIVEREWLVIADLVRITGARP